jgi:alpha-amylase/alpha-mannosidase (GH57 family)
MPFYFTVHGHFYQPSREDPLTGLLPTESCPSPYSNWNECIYQHCYRPNAEMGNFRKISFDVGPTLFRWLEQEHPDTYQQILDQEREAYQLFGVSNAMAQSFYHLILPLASRRDKQTQIRWGIKEYEHRFRHTPMGLWLPETAVDMETLEILAEEEIQFTILAPWQADSEQINTNTPYQVELPSGNDMVVFFYDGYLSGQVSFYPAATQNADEFINAHVLSAFHGETGADKLVMIASDGELYGHHQPFRDKFLSFLLDGAANAAGLRVIFPGRWIDQLSTENIISIRQDTSWSCHHGVERWRGICGDAPFAYWKAPLRNALNHLAEAIDQVYLNFVTPLIEDAWDLRDDYIQVLLGNQSVAELVKSHVKKTIDAQSIQTIEMLLKAEDNRMKMFASDAWFFDEFDRIEPRNAIHYAAFAAWQVLQSTGKDVFTALKEDLSQAISFDGKTAGDAVFDSFWETLK